MYENLIEDQNEEQDDDDDDEREEQNEAQTFHQRVCERICKWWNINWFWLLNYIRSRRDQNIADSQQTSRGKPFKDPTFTNPEIWRRPHTIIQYPMFKVNSFSRFDLNQGPKDNCWFLVALANLTLQQTNFERVVPIGNFDFDNPKYAGIFHFRFWAYGRWVEVVIDDKLPTMVDENNKIQLIYSKSHVRNEFWGALVEKAYAKLNGGYHIFDGGKTAEAMQDFTGGVTELYSVEVIEEGEVGEEEDEEQVEEVDNIEVFPIACFELLRKRFQKRSLMMAEYKTGGNLNHAYSITDVRIEKKKDTHSNQQVKFIRLRNPYGDEGILQWAEEEPEAHMLSLDELEQYNLSNDNPHGEFWMYYNDFTKCFYRVQLCNLNLLPSSDGGNGNWRNISFEGAWTKEMPAGNVQAAVCENPQYKIALTGIDPDDKCTIVISLIQKNRRNQRKRNLSLKFFIYRTDHEVTEDMESFQEYTKFLNLREIAEKFELPAGNYILIPCRHEPGQSCEFLLRVFSKSYLNKI